MMNDDYAGLVQLAREVAATAKKVDFYKDARRDAPESLTKALKEKEGTLDQMVKELFEKKPEFKSEILEHQSVTDEALREIEFSYHKAMCFLTPKDGAPSRMFFLPFVFWSEGKNMGRNVLDFTASAKKESLKQFVASFVMERFADESMKAPQVEVYGQSILDWSVLDEEERGIPVLHQALLDGFQLDLSVAFPERARVLADSDEEGWSLGVLPFALRHEDEAFLESIDFVEFEEDFMEQFEEIFDPASQADYSAPVDPSMMQNEGIRLLWGKQLDLMVGEMARIKKSKHYASVQATMVWNGQELDAVVMDFRVGEDGEEPLYHRQMSRQALLGETSAELAGFLASYAPLIREDFELVIQHQLTPLEEI